MGKTYRRDPYDENYVGNVRKTRKQRKQQRQERHRRDERLDQLNQVDQDYGGYSDDYTPRRVDWRQ